MTSIKKYLRKKVYKKTNGFCSYCGRKLSETWVCEHVTPKSKGGRNIFDNLLPSCRFCNAVKKTSDLEEFRIKIQNQISLAINSNAFRLYLFLIQDEKDGKLIIEKTLELRNLIAKNTPTFYFETIEESSQ